MKDRILGLLLFLLFMPLLAMLALVSLFCIGRRCIFHSTRLGLRRKPFEIFKYTTMAQWTQRQFEEYLEQHPECKAQWQRQHKLFNDPRCSRWGYFLRRSSLDELPQLLNVVRGDMALVGPRPITAEEEHKYGHRAQQLFSVKPGITGLWQVSGRNLITYRRRIAMDIYYTRHRSFFLDLWILCKTFRAVICGKGAF